MFPLRLVANVPETIGAAVAHYMRQQPARPASPTAGATAPTWLASSRHPAVPNIQHVPPSRQPPYDIIWPAAQLDIQVPRGMPYVPELAVQLITTLSGLRCLTSLGIRSRSGQISYPVVVPWSASEAARSALLAVAPRAMIVRREPMPRDDRPFVIAFGNRRGMPWAPLAGLGSARTPDPLNPLLQVLASLRSHEECLLQIMLRPASADWSQIIYQAITSKAIPWGDLFNLSFVQIVPTCLKRAQECASRRMEAGTESQQVERPRSSRREHSAL